MLLRGRGIVIDGDPVPWFFELEKREGRLGGEIRVEGWEPSAIMNSWYESARERGIEMILQGHGRVLLTPKGIRIHESGHHNETSINVEGLLLPPED